MLRINFKIQGYIFNSNVYRREAKYFHPCSCRQCDADPICNLQVLVETHICVTSTFARPYLHFDELPVSCLCDLAADDCVGPLRRETFEGSGKQKVFFSIRCVYACLFFRLFLSAKESDWFWFVRGDWLCGGGGGGAPRHTNALFSLFVRLTYLSSCHFCTWAGIKNSYAELSCFACVPLRKIKKRDMQQVRVQLFTRSIFSWHIWLFLRIMVNYIILVREMYMLNFVKFNY